MASFKYHADVKLWRCFWHVTLPDGSVEKGSKSFKDKQDGLRYKKFIEEKEKQLKNAFIIDVPLFEFVKQDWENNLLRYEERTEDLYKSCFKSFTDYVKGRVEYVSDITPQLVNKYINYLLKNEKTARTANNHLSTIKNFARFAEENYQIPLEIEKIKKLKEAPAKAKFMTLEEYKLVVEKAEGIAKPWIKFLATTGLRATEFCNLIWKDWNRETNSITFVGKGNKERTVGLNSTATEVLENLRPKKIKLSDTIFKRADGEAATRHTLYHYIEKASLKADLHETKGPHALRHFFATQLLIRGVPIFKVSKLLGHESVTTTEQRYAHILTPDLRGATSCLEGL